MLYMVSRKIFRHQYPVSIGNADCKISYSPLGPQTSISTTLAFAPGELTTLEGFCIVGCAATSHRFDPADMPCGPRAHVGGAVDYGGSHTPTMTFSYGGTNTYQPLFAQPSGLNQLFPEWWNCTAATGFMGHDPPHTLEVATAMVAPVTKVDQANSQSTPAAPSPTTPPLPIDTGATADPAVKLTTKADLPQGDTKPSQGAPPAKDPAIPVAPTLIPSSNPEASPNALLPINAGAIADSAVKVTTKADLPQGDTNPSQGAPLVKVPAIPVAPTPMLSSNPQANQIAKSPERPAPTLVPQSVLSVAEAHQSSLGDPSTPQDPAGSDPANAGQASAKPDKLLGSLSQSDAAPFDGAEPASSIANLPPGSSPQAAVPADSGNADPVSVLVGPSLYSAPQSASVPGGNRPQASHWAIGGLTFSAVPSATQQNLADPNAGSGPGIGPSLGLAGLLSMVVTTAGVGQAYTAQAPGMLIGVKTLLPGGPAISVSGTVVSLASSHIVIGTSTISLPSPAPTPSMTDLQPLPTFTLAGQTYTAIPTGFEIGSATLLPGASPIFISGTPVSLASSQLVIGTSTLPILTLLPTSTTRAFYITIGSETLALGPTAIIVAGSTLTPGAPAITTDGNAVSLGSSMLVVGSRTETFAPVQASVTSSAGIAIPGAANLGALILSGLGAVGGGTVAAPSQTGIGAIPSGSGNGSAMTFTGVGVKKSHIQMEYWTVAWLGLSTVIDTAWT